MGNALLDAGVCRQALAWRASGRRVAVAVVLQTWGSAPRPVGARLFARDDGEFCGSVSGGCIEGAVIAACGEALANGRAQELNFGVADETAWDVGLSCGGEISVLVYPLTDAAAECLRHALQLLEERRAGFLTTHMQSGEQCLQDENGKILCGVPAVLTANKIKEIRSGVLYSESVFVEPLTPPPRLLIVGATHIAQFLIQTAAQLDFAAIVIDPRQAWATPQRFAGADLRQQWPDDALKQTGIGEYDAVIALTHDPKIDDPALLAALAAKPFYIGALGSRRTHTKRLARLAEAGVCANAAAAIHAPIGINLGATTAAEIALAIAAEVLSAYRQQGEAA